MTTTTTLFGAAIISAIAAAGACCIARAAPSPEQPKPQQNLDTGTTTTNDVGCQKTVYIDPRYPDGRSKGILFYRPPNLAIEALTEPELDTCGLPTRGSIRGLPKSSPEYKAWLKEAHDLLNAKQGLPWSTISPLSPRLRRPHPEMNYGIGQDQIKPEHIFVPSQK